jgi:hypothetical protein
VKVTYVDPDKNSNFLGGFESIIHVGCNLKYNDLLFRFGTGCGFLGDKYSLRFEQQQEKFRSCSIPTLQTDFVELRGVEPVTFPTYKSGHSDPAVKKAASNM